jgi:hypothetical protein
MCAHRPLRRNGDCGAVESISRQELKQMLTAEQIVKLLLERIGHLYDQPQLVAFDICELDGILHELHWLHAIATGDLDGFVSVLTLEPRDEFLARVNLMKSQRLVELPEHAAEVIARWQKIDDRLGLKIPLVTHYQNGTQVVDFPAMLRQQSER